jgi:hypothetical protein
MLLGVTKNGNGKEFRTPDTYGRYLHERLLG